MKKIIYSIFIILLITTYSCNKETTTSDNGAVDAVLLGEDYRTCICCGGMMISFVPNAQKYKDSFNIVNTFPRDFSINDTMVFPMKVQVIWKFSDQKSCTNQKIDISWIKIK